MKTGLELIQDERKRQIEVEGWTAEHDDQYQQRELLKAASCYYQAAHNTFEINQKVPEMWPWDASWWKPSENSVRMLVKAGALYMAHDDLLKRHRKTGWSDWCLFTAIAHCGILIDQKQNELHGKVIKMLLEVAREAWFLMDDTETSGDGKQLSVDANSFERLSKAMDALDALPEPSENIVGTGPAKARAILIGTVE